MFVSPELRARVNARLIEAAAIINKAYNITMPMPTVSYDMSGVRVLGLANFGKMEVKFNPIYLTAKPDEFIKQTVPHELAHIADSYMCALDGRIKIKRVGGRIKRDIHGYSWKMIMLALGLPPDRCSNIALDDNNTPRVRTMKSTSREYMCSKCNTIIVLGAKSHAREKANPGTYWHNGHRGHRLSLVTKNTNLPGIVIMKTSPVPKPATPVSGTKMQICYDLYKKHHDWSRKQLIDMFVSHANMTPAGASTYVQSCKKMYEGGII